MTAKRLLVWLGRLLAIATLVYLGFAIRRQWAGLSAWRPSLADASLIAMAAIVYGLALFLVAEAWHRLVSSSAGMRLSRNLTIPSMGVTQIAKYLPGNVLHFVGRHTWLSRAGVPHSTLARALVWEAACLVAASVLTASLFSLAWPLDAEPIPIPLRQASAAALAMLLAGFGLVTFLRARFPLVSRWTPSPAVAAAAILAMSAFFLIQGLVFVALTLTIDTAPRLNIIPIPITAWLVGFLTPGAPGGVGTRELVLVALMTPAAGPSKALIITTLFRVVTLVGDVVCFLVSSALARRQGVAVKS